MHKHRGLSIAIVALLTVISTQSSPPESDASYRYEDVYQALSSLREYMPDNMPMDERCKRYAVLFTMCDMQAQPHQLAVNQLVVLHEDILNLVYRALDWSNLKLHLMTAIDRYVTTKLEPPFIDLVECLRIVDPSLIGTYPNQELTVLTILYEEVLAHPSTPIDINGLDLTGYTPHFQHIIRTLFTGKNGTHEESLELNRTAATEVRHPGQESIGIVQEDQELVGEALDRHRERIRLSSKRFRERHLEEIRERDRNRKRAERLMISALAEGPSESVRPQGTLTIAPLDDYEREWAERKRRQNRERQRRYRLRNLDSVRLDQRRRQQQRRDKYLQAILDAAKPSQDKHSGTPIVAPEAQQPSKDEPAPVDDEAALQRRQQQHQELQRLRLHKKRQRQRQMRLQSMTEEERQVEEHKSQMQREKQRAYRQRHLWRIQAQERERSKERRQRVKVLKAMARDLSGAGTVPAAAPIVKPDSAGADATSPSLVQLLQSPVFEPLPQPSPDQPLPGASYTSFDVNQQMNQPWYGFPAQTDHSSLGAPAFDHIPPARLDVNQSLLESTGGLQRGVLDPVAFFPIPSESPQLFTPTAPRQSLAGSIEYNSLLPQHVLQYQTPIFDHVGNIMGDDRVPFSSVPRDGAIVDSIADPSFGLDVNSNVPIGRPDELDSVFRASLQDPPNDGP